MSAYVVDKKHIGAMIGFGMRSMAKGYGPLRWRVGEDRFQLTDETRDKVGQMLLDENVKAVGIRYPEDKLAELPGRTDAEYVLPFTWRPFDKLPTDVEALKLISCYEYQSCEDPDFSQTEAKAFCEALRHFAISELPGYDEAPWEWTEKRPANADVHV